ncbi:MAG: aminotransferase class I/II-fold pyridoxal phosphate-dependent enzyme [Alphaproteobacteria bacterium]|nr:aminotransferase class I/II-fold pyridoxal phosphate-dependent enzyme [Alphaproteobacteria bacterium]
MWKESRRAGIAPFHAMDVLKAANERAASGAPTLHLEVGEPGAGTPPRIREAAALAIRESDLGYTEAFGLPDLRARIAAYYQATHRVNVDVEDIAITAGSSAGFVLSFLAAFDAGARVAMAVPFYPGYRNIMCSLGLTPVLLRTGTASRYQPTVELLEQAGPLDGLLLASPANPTGTMIESRVLWEILDYCERRGIRVISDEIYHGITYGRPADTVLSRHRSGIVLNGFSKYYCMTGWRLGWMVVPADLRQAVQRLQQNLFIAAPTPAQRAAAVAFECTSELDTNVAAYARNRAKLLAGLRLAGVNDVAPADGAFYLFAHVGHLTNDSAVFCRQLLEETGVAITPGVDFDIDEGSAYVRLSYAGSEATITEASMRLATWLKRKL